MSAARTPDSSMPSRYAVVGHPVAHSRSPEIHAAFARETGIAVDYRRLLAPLDGFAATVRGFFDDGGRGVNVTVPFKLEARALCGSRTSARAAAAGAVNCIRRDDDGLFGDNTDGIGLVDDLRRLVDDTDRPLAGARLLLLGAGGAARGVIGPLLAAGPRSLVVANRDRAKADALVASWPDGPIASSGLDIDGEPFDLVVNATSASLAGHALPIAPRVFANASLVYDMAYGGTPTAFLVAAKRAGARTTADGLGMLVEQAAESFLLWHGVRPRTAPVREALRAALVAEASR